MIKKCVFLKFLQQTVSAAFQIIVGNNYVRIVHLLANHFHRLKESVDYCTGPPFVFTSRSVVVVAAASTVSRWLTDRQNAIDRSVLRTVVYYYFFDISFNFVIFIWKCLFFFLSANSFYSQSENVPNSVRA